MNRKNARITPLILLVCLMASCDTPIYAEGATAEYCPVFPGNILENPSFEDGSDVSATSWSKRGGGRYGHRSKTEQDECYIAGNAHIGQKCVAIANGKTGLARW